MPDTQGIHSTGSNYTNHTPETRNSFKWQGETVNMPQALGSQNTNDFVIRFEQQRPAKLCDSVLAASRTASDATCSLQPWAKYHIFFRPNSYITERHWCIEWHRQVENLQILLLISETKSALSTSAPNACLFWGALNVHPLQRGPVKVECGTINMSSIWMHDQDAKQSSSYELDSPEAANQRPETRYLWH